MIYSLYFVIGIIWALIAYEKIRRHNAKALPAIATAFLLHGIFWPIGIVATIAFNVFLRLR